MTMRSWFRVFSVALCLSAGLFAIVHSGGFISPSENIPEELLPEDPLPAIIVNQDSAAFEPARYSITWLRGRIRIVASTIVSADSKAIVSLPLGNLSLEEASLDGVEADLLVRDGKVLIQVPSGRHQLSLVGALGIERTLGGRHAEWAPGLPGGATVTPELRIEGAASSGAEYLLAGQPVKIIVGARAGGAGTGSWSVDVEDTIQISAGALSCEIAVAFEAFGVAPETFAIRLPADLTVISVDGDAQSLDAPAGRVVLLPVTDAGKILIHAEGAIPRDRLRIDSLDVEGASRKNISFRLVTSPELFLEPAERRGVVEEQGRFRVVTWPWHYEAVLTGVDVVEGRGPSIKDAHTTLSVLDDGRCFGEVIVTLNEPLQKFRMFLPEGAEILSAVAENKAVAPVKSESSIVIPMLDAMSATIVYRMKNPLSITGRFDLPMPRIEPAPRASSIEVWTPSRSVLFRADGPWSERDGRRSVLEMMDSILEFIGGAGMFLMKIVLFILFWAAVIWGLLAIGRMTKSYAVPFIILLVVGVGVIVVALFMPMFDMGSRLSDGMFSTAVGTGTMGQNQAALSGGIYGDEAGIPAEALFMDKKVSPEAPPPLPSASRRAGGYSIHMELPTSGVLHAFDSIEPYEAGALRLTTLHWSLWALLVAAVIAICGVFFHSRPGHAPTALVFCAFADVLIPGAFVASLGGMAAAAVVIIFRSLRSSMTSRDTSPSVGIGG